MFSCETIHAQLVDILTAARARDDPAQLGMVLDSLISQLLDVRKSPVDLPETALYLAVLSHIEGARYYMRGSTPLWGRVEGCIQEAVGEFGSSKAE